LHFTRFLVNTEFARFCEGFAKGALAVGIGTLAGFGGVSLITDQLHNATLQQCADQAWPAHQHDAHVAFCDDYTAGAFTTASLEAK
jgi:hypothetical protein